MLDFQLLCIQVLRGSQIPTKFCQLLNLISQSCIACPISKPHTCLCAGVKLKPSSAIIKDLFFPYHLISLSVGCASKLFQSEVFSLQRCADCCSGLDVVVVFIVHMFPLVSQFTWKNVHIGVSDWCDAQYIESVNIVCEHKMYAVFFFSTLFCLFTNSLSHSFSCCFGLQLAYKKPYESWSQTIEQALTQGCVLTYWKHTMCLESPMVLRITVPMILGVCCPREKECFLNIIKSD